MSAPKRHQQHAVRAARASGAAIALLGIFTAIGPRAATAQVDGTFSLVARADISTIEMVYTSAPIAEGGQVLLLSPAGAQSLFTTLLSQGFASAPTPGPFTEGLPGTVSGASGGQFNVPNYPLTVHSDSGSNPDPEPIEAGTYKLETKSSVNGTTATALLGEEGSDARAAQGRAATSAARGADGTYTAQAVSEADGFALTDAISVGRSRSSAKLTIRPGQRPVVETSFVGAAVTVAGVNFGVTEEGLVADEKALGPVDAAAANAALAAAGIDIKFVPPESSPTSATSGGVRISQPFEVPGQGTGRLTYVIGRARVAGAATPAAAAEATGTAAAPTDTAPAPGPSAGTGGGDPAEPSAPPPEVAGGATDASTESPEVAAPAAAPARATAPGLGTAPPGAEGQTVRALRAQPSAVGFYLVLVGAGLLAVTSSRLLGNLGVRGRLRSSASL